MNNNTANKSHSIKGFSLVELLVAATIGILCITSVVAMLQKGREIDINDKYRRYAKALVISEFEDQKLHFSQYVNLLNKAGTTTENVTIDTRGAYNNISGILTTTIGNETIAFSSDGTNVPYILITIAIAWSTTDGNDNLAITKFITQASE